MMVRLCLVKGVGLDSESGDRLGSEAACLNIYYTGGIRGCSVY